MVWLLWKTVGQFLKKLGIELSYNPEIPLLSTQSRKIKIQIHTKTHTRVFMAALSTKTKKWKQPKHPTPGELINKCGIIHTMEYYLEIKILTHAVVYLNLENIMLS